jgi:serine O-acetyltransferase
MIKNKADFKEYLRLDKDRYPTPPKFASRILHTEKYYVWRQIKNLRRLEYYMNTQTNVFRRILYYFQMWKYYRIMHYNNIYIYPNVFGPGLYIPHLGRILTPPQAKFGKNCTIRPGVLIMTNLGVSNKKYYALVAGDNVELSEGCKIICKKIGNNVKIGPNAVVIRNVPDNTTAYAPPCEFLDQDV